MTFIIRGINPSFNNIYNSIANNNDATEAALQQKFQQICGFSTNPVKIIKESTTQKGGENMFMISGRGGCSQMGGFFPMRGFNFPMIGHGCHRSHHGHHSSTRAFFNGLVGGFIGGIGGSLLQRYAPNLFSSNYNIGVNDGYMMGQYDGYGAGYSDGFNDGFVNCFW